MDIVRRIATWLYEKNLLRFIPWRFIRTYIYPLSVRRKKKTYQAGNYFESYYKSVADTEFSDRVTIGPNVHPLHSHYHYNVVENSIIRHFIRKPAKPQPSVLDIGSGAGHWIDFYLDTFDASLVYGLEISKTCADSLKTKYDSQDKVVIGEGDISSKDFALNEKFDIISAVGVMFHIVDDNLWQQALTNLCSLLKDDGVIIVGGLFGLITQNAQFHSIDDFDSLDELQKKSQAKDILVNKRIRSLRFWKRTARKCGLDYVRVIRTSNIAEIFTPENNILVLSHLKSN